MSHGSAYEPESMSHSYETDNSDEPEVGSVRWRDRASPKEIEKYEQECEAERRYILENCWMAKF